MEASVIDFLMSTEGQMCMIVLLNIMIVILVVLLVYRGVQAEKRKQRRIQELHEKHGSPRSVNEVVCTGFRARQPLGQKYCNQCGMMLFRDLKPLK